MLLLVSIRPDEHGATRPTECFCYLVSSQISSLQVAAELLNCHLSTLLSSPCPSFAPASRDNMHLLLCHILRQIQAPLVIVLMYILILYLIDAVQNEVQDSSLNQHNTSRLRI